MQPLNEEQIRQIVRDELEKNYMAGSPDIPPHTHNGTDGLNIETVDLTGWTPLPTTNKKFLNPDGTLEYGFASAQQLAGGATGGHASQYVVNTQIAQYPIPIVVGNGVGSQSTFEGGYAPEGVLVFFANGSTLNGLYVRFDGNWYGVNLPLLV